MSLVCPTQALSSHPILARTLHDKYGYVIFRCKSAPEGNHPLPANEYQFKDRSSFMIVCLVRLTYSFLVPILIPIIPGLILTSSVPGFTLSPLVPGCTSSPFVPSSAPIYSSLASFPTVLSLAPLPIDSYPCLNRQSTSTSTTLINY